MFVFRGFVIFALIFSAACGGNRQSDQPETCPKSFLEEKENGKLAVRGALVSTRFSSFEELKEVVQIDYFSKHFCENPQCSHEKNGVRLSYCSNGKQVISILKSGVSEIDFVNALNGGFWDRIQLLLKSPYAVANRKNLQRVSTLARRRPQFFGVGDPAFYDISEKIINNISTEDTILLDRSDLMSDKGYFNTINHITAQVFMTSLFSEKLADFVADAHERKNLPELVTGNFTAKQLMDLKTGPVDNYVDMINNEWGQELGKVLKKKYNISCETHWTPEFLADYLNDIQRYYNWSFQVGFDPFVPEDEVVIKFSTKVNSVMKN